MIKLWICILRELEVNNLPRSRLQAEEDEIKNQLRGEVKFKITDVLSF
jgi:hypothetical protein